MRCIQEKKLVGLLILIIAAFSGLSADMRTEARPRDEKNRRAVDVSSSRQGLVPAAPGSNITSYNIITYEFGLSDFMGWTKFDNTAGIDTFFHVDDFHDLDGFAPLEGTKSMWCGAGLRDLEQDPNKYYFCSWVSPGYGNDWNQALYSKHVSFADSVTLSYALSIDFEGPWDRLLLQYYDSTGAYWDTIAFYGQSDPYEAVESYTISPTQEKVAFRFIFRSDELVSSEDEEWGVEYNGAVIIDSITIASDSTTIDYEDFESWPVGASNLENIFGGLDGMWYALKFEGHGIHSHIIQNAEQFDPMQSNLTPLVLFNNPADPATNCYNLIYKTDCTPYCNIELDCLCQDEMIISPEIDLVMYSSSGNEEQDVDIPIVDLENLNATELSFDVYLDLPLASYVFYFWQIRAVKDGCPGPWIDRWLIYYGDRVWTRHVEDISDLLEQIEFDWGADRLQIGVGVVDMVMRLAGTCDQPPHSPSPYFDNISIDRHVASDPQWEFESIELFADNFPSDETFVESWIRADMSKDTDGRIDAIRLGDSIVVSCTSRYGGGVDSINGRAAVFMHVYCEYVGDPSTPKPLIDGPDLEGSYGSFYGMDGGWTVIQGEEAVPHNLERDKYMFDLNDALLTRGYKVRYFFEAFNREGSRSTLPDRLGDVSPGGQYFDSTFVFKCLPMSSGNFIIVTPDRYAFPSPGSKFWWTLDEFFPEELIEDQCSIFGALGPENAEPGPITSHSSLYGRCSLSQLVEFYDLIIWNSGPWSRNLLSDGDAMLLADWLDSGGKLWMIGDNLASWIDGLGSPAAQNLMDLCGVQFVAPSYYDLTGGMYGEGTNNPPVICIDPMIFSNGWSFYLAKDPEIDNTFDVIEAKETGRNVIEYPESGGFQYYAGVSNETYTGESWGKTVWFGFSWESIREMGADSPMARNLITRDIFQWLGIPVADITGGENIPLADRLWQNWPNPFNPSTQIRFGVRLRGHVRIDIFDVAGRLVKTLLDENMDAGIHRVSWDGKNQAGTRATSGVYFYKIKANGFEKSKKMVLLR